MENGKWEMGKWVGWGGKCGGSLHLVLERVAQVQSFCIANVLYF